MPRVPVGIYGVASRAQGTAVRVSWLVALGGDEAWVDFAGWVWCSPGMAGSLPIPRFRVPIRSLRRDRQQEGPLPG